VGDVAILREIIEAVDRMYLTFTASFYSQSDVQIPVQNLKKLRIDVALADKYFTQTFIGLYMSALTNDKQLDNEMLSLGMRYNFRHRSKNVDTIYRKMAHNSGRSMYVAKILNDFMGARIILDSVISEKQQIAELLKDLKDQGIISRYYVRLDGQYTGIHCYFQDENTHFPWELQVWDASKAENNYLEHERHERERNE